MNGRMFVKRVDGEKWYLYQVWNSYNEMWSTYLHPEGERMSHAFTQERVRNKKHAFLFIKRWKELRRCLHK